jgi:hypothetical protein
MSQSFIISAITFLIIMVLFHIVKDVILGGYIITPAKRRQLNKRWLTSTAIGLVILYVIYGCTSEIEICNKGEPSIAVICTEIYQPIRAPDGTVYPNSCYAEADGWDNKCLVLQPIYD